MKFRSFAQLSAHTLVVEEAMHEAITEGIRGASREILSETKKVIGTYQGAAGPYQAWAPLSLVTQEDRVKKGFPADEPELRTGELHDSYEMDVDGLQGGVGSANPIALGQEIGNPLKNVPARPILGMAFVRSEKKAFAWMVLPISVLLGGRAKLNVR